MSFQGIRHNESASRSKYERESESPKIAKQTVADKIAEAFGENFLGEYDKKYYVIANDGGEQVQIAISLTCPKNPVEFAVSANTDGDWDFTDDKPKAASVAVSNAAPAEISQQEKDNIAALMERLGL